MKKHAISPLALVLSTFSALVPLCAARADMGAFDPKLNGVVLFETQHDWNFRSEDRENRVNNTFATVEPYLVLSLNDRIAVETALVLEQVRDEDPGRNSFFNNHGLYVQQLKATYTGDNYTLFAGKANLNFGTAWDLAPGLYGTTFAEDYETAEKMALGGGYTLPENTLGTVTLGANVYFSDNTILSDSVLRHRPRTRNADGGVTNTQDPSSYIVTADMADAVGIAGLAVHAGHRSQHHGDADPADANNEHGTALGANYTHAVNDTIDANILGEMAQINNIDGGSDDVRHTTAAISFVINEHWNAGLSYGRRDTAVQGGSDIHDTLSQITGGYAFDNGITFDLSYARFKEDGVRTDTVGALVAYAYEF